MKKLFRFRVRNSKSRFRVLVISRVQRATYFGLSDDVPEIIRHPTTEVIDA
jgi:hypothetical protein